MASIKYMWASDVRGKQGGTIYSNGIGGAYIKNWAKPSNPQSARQLVVRSQLATLASGWRALTDADRGAWDGAKGNFPATNKFGDAYTPTGYQVYMGLNSNLNVVAASLLSTPPLPVSLTSTYLASVAFVLTAGAITTCEINTTVDNSATESIVIEATGGLSAGISAPSDGLFKLVTTSDVEDTNFVVTTPYQALFGIPALGTKVFFKVSLISRSTGQRALLGKMSVIVSGT